MAWRLWGKKVVVVGGGAIGEGKIETMLRTGAHLEVIDPTPSTRVVELAEAGTLVLKRRRVRRRDLRQATLVVAATGNHETNAWITRWGHRWGAIVNAVDDPDLCDVTVPAVLERGAATVAITTNGATPAGARFLREELTSAIPAEVGTLLDHAATARDHLRNSGDYRYDYAAWRQRFFEPGMDAIRSGRPTEIDAIRSQFEAEFAADSSETRPGKVTLVGAGPGGADLITIRGARALAAADVVLYDRLADPDLLALAPAAAIKLPVGKGKGHGPRQEEISDLLVRHALDGSHVVRLKGGDPFVFGRGNEEIEAATRRGIDVEVVPGLSSAIAAATLSRIPLTDRRHAASFTVLSGHRAGDGDYDWNTLARDDTTLVVLMAASTAREVAERLIAAGRRAETPVAAVHRAGFGDEQIEVLSLAEVSLVGCPLPSPCVMIIGTVAGLAKSSPTAPHLANLVESAEVVLIS